MARLLGNSNNIDNNMSDIEKIYKSVESGQFNKLKDAMEYNNCEFGVIIPSGFGFNVHIEPYSIVIKICDTFTKRKIVNTLFKMCGALHVTLEISSLGNIGAILYSNKKLGHYLLLLSENNDKLNNKIKKSDFGKFNINILGWSETIEFFNKYYYNGTLTNFT